MASIIISGTLLDPSSKLAIGDEVRFTHRTTTGSTIQSAQSSLTIGVSGTYSIELQFGLILVEYKDHVSTNFKNLGVVTVNQDSTATSLPELLNAIVPPTDAQLLEFQAILADCVTAQAAAEAAADVSEAFANQLTTTELIASTATYAANVNIGTSGFFSSGDNGNGNWIQTGLTGQTVSQSPAQLNDWLLNDGNGNQWSLVVNGAVNALSIGVTRDGVSSFSALTALKTGWQSSPQTLGSQTPKNSERALYFPSGHYSSNSDVYFETVDTGQSIYGDGPSTNMGNNIRFNINSYRSLFRDFMVSGTGSTGVSTSDTSAISQKGAVLSNLWIRDRTTNLILGKGAWGKIDNIHAEKAGGNNVELTEGSGYPLTNINANDATQDNWVIKNGASGSGEYKLNNCIGINAGRYNLRIEGSTANQAVESYFNQCTFTNAQRTRLLTINSIVDIDGSNVKVTFTTDHLLFDGQGDVNVTGTTSYDGNYTIAYISDTEISIPATYLSDGASGQVDMPNWDVFIDVPSGADPITRVNDMFFNGGNINYLYIKRGYSINFFGTRLKSQIQLGEVNRVMFMRQSRGRMVNSFQDLPINGANTGWSDIAYKDSDSAIAAGGGSMAISSPNNAIVSNNGLPTLHEMRVAETGITFTSIDKFIKLDRASQVISVGVITATNTYQTTDTEGASATDDLNTINGGTDGEILILSGASSTRVVTVKHNIGNIRLDGAADFAMTSGPRSRLTLQYDSRVNQWIEISRSNA